MGAKMSLYEWATVGLKYVAVLGLLAGLTIYYQSSNNNRRSKGVKAQRGLSNPPQPAEAPLASETRQPREKRREKRRDAAGEAHSGDDVKPASAPAAHVAADTTHKAETDDLAFAQELANLKKGTNFAVRSRGESRQKTVKLSNANKHAELSAPSSTGAEGDDDMSPPASPSIDADEIVPRSNVSDMLEAAGPGPSVLRLTEPLQPARLKAAKQHKPAPAQETKKQRQHKKKAEEEKEIRAQTEQQRQALLEKQRRTAREARGEPAKNGVPAPKPASNAWSPPNGASAVQAPLSNDPLSNDSLLDTFVETRPNGSSSGFAPASKPAASTTNAPRWQRDLPDEDEQMRRILENDDSNWATVPTAKRGRKKQPGAGNTESSDNADDTAAPAVGRPMLFEQEA